MPRARRSSASSRSISVAVESTSLTDSMSRTTQRAGGSRRRRRRRDVVAEDVRVGEEQRGVEAVQDDPRLGDPVGRGVRAPEAVGARHPHEERRPRPGGTLGHEEERQDGDDHHAREHAHGHDDDRRDHREDRLRARDAGEPAELGRVEQARATTMMTPASAAFGSGANNGVRKSSVTRTSSSTPTLASCERAPTSAAVKLRDWLPLTGKPPVSGGPDVGGTQPQELAVRRRRGSRRAAPAPGR